MYENSFTSKEKKNVNIPVYLLFLCSFEKIKAKNSQNCASNQKQVMRWSILANDFMQKTQKNEQF